MRYIDADAPYTKLEELYKCSGGAAHIAYRAAMNAICETPTVDAALVVHAHWEFENDYESLCTACGECAGVDHADEPKYRPNCGAHMIADDANRDQTELPKVPASHRMYAYCPFNQKGKCTHKGARPGTCEACGAAGGERKTKSGEG